MSARLRRGFGRLQTLRLLGCLSLLVGGGLALAPRPPTDNSVKAMTDTGDERAEYYESLPAEFRTDEVVVVALEATSTATLAAVVEEIEGLLEDTEAIEQLLGPGTIFPEVTAVMADPELFTGDVLARARRTIAGPLGRNLSVLSLDPPEATLHALARSAPPERWAELKRALDEARDRWRPAGVTMIYGGTPFLNLALDREGTRVQTQALPVLIGVCVLTLLLVLGSVRNTICLLVPVGCVVLGSEGVLGLLGGENNLIVNVAKPLLFVISLASAVHVVVAYDHALADGRDRPEAARYALRRKGRGVSLALLTPATGFASLALAEVNPIRVFGLLTGGGLLGAGALVLLGIPTLLSWFGAPSARRRGLSGARLEELLVGYGAWAERHPVPLVLFAVLVIAGGVAALPRLEPSTHPLEYFPKSHPLRQAHEALAANGAGLRTLELVVDAKTRSATSAAWLEELDRFATTATSIPGLDARLDLAVLVREASHRNTGLESFPNAFYTEMLLERRSEMNALFAQGSRSRVAFLLSHATPPDVLDTISSRLHALGDELLEGTELHVTGSYDLLVRAQRSLLDTLVESLGLTLLLMELVLLLALRSFKLALAALLPNVFPVAVNALLMWALSIPLDVGTAMTGAVALGIAVDDTLHYLVAYKDEGRERAFRRTGTALVMSSVVMTLGFAALMPSEFLPTRSFALLTGAAMITALLADLTLLPPLTRWLAPRAEG